MIDWDVPANKNNIGLNTGWITSRPTIILIERAGKTTIAPKDSLFQHNIKQYLVNSVISVKIIKITTITISSITISYSRTN